MTDILSYGEGPPLLVIHGGPGFDHRYLVEPLEFLRSSRTLIYYDQIGCGSAPAPEGGATLDATALQLVDVIGRVFPSGPAAVLAHSWGALVLAAALEAMRERRRPARVSGMLINPVPVSRAAFDQGRDAFQATVPPAVLGEVHALAQTGASGADIMRPLIPYYLADRTKAAQLSLPVSMATYASVMAQLGDFAFPHVADDFRDLTVLIGSADITPFLLLEPITRAARAVHVIERAGHFPLHERPEACRPILEAVFGAAAPIL